LKLKGKQDTAEISPTLSIVNLWITVLCSKCCWSFHQSWYNFSGKTILHKRLELTSWSPLWPNALWFVS